MIRIRHSKIQIPCVEGDAGGLKRIRIDVETMDLVSLFFQPDQHPSRSAWGVQQPSSGEVPKQVQKRSFIHIWNTWPWVRSNPGVSLHGLTQKWFFMECDGHRSIPSFLLVHAP